MNTIKANQHAYNRTDAHVAGDTAHAKATDSCAHNCPHHRLVRVSVDEAGCSVWLTAHSAAQLPGVAAF
jgi:hypothetical protein